MICTATYRTNALITAKSLFATGREAAVLAGCINSNSFGGQHESFYITDQWYHDNSSTDISSTDISSTMTFLAEIEAGVMKRKLYQQNLDGLMQGILPNQKWN